MATTEKPQEIHREEHETYTAEAPDLDKHVVVDTVHKDEAMKVLANYTGDEAWDQEEERQLRRKIDRRLLPILCITYGECPVLLMGHPFKKPLQLFGLELTTPNSYTILRQGDDITSSKFVGSNSTLSAS
jgi:hypothetical protein